MSTYGHFRMLWIILVFTGINFYGQKSTAQTPLKTIIIKGMLVDSTTRSPIELATVAVTRPGHQLVQSTLTAADGSFLLKVPEGSKLTLHISYVGYRAYTSGVHPVAGLADMGLIRVSANSGVLNEVVVSGKKPVIQSKGDKLIYNAASDIGNRTGSAEDVLRKAPMISISADGEVRLRGNGNIKVLLNGLPSGILARNLKEAMKMIPASAIAAVEIMTSPSARYEAEGAAGVINIITKKKMEGTGGSIDLSAGNLEQTINGNLNMTRGKFSVNLNLEGSLEKSRTVTELNRDALAGGQVIGNLLQQTDETQRNRGGFAELSAEYRMDTSRKITGGVSYWKGSWPTVSQGYNLYMDKHGVNEYNQTGRQTGNVHFTEFSLNYQQKFRHPGQELQLISQYSFAGEKADYQTDQIYISGKHYFREHSPNTGSSKDLSLQADYAQPLDHKGDQLLEVGGRYSRNTSRSSYRVFNNRQTPGSEQLTEDPSRANVMSYFQEIAAAYVNLSLKAGRNWAFRLGTRYEHTSLGSDFQQYQPAFRSRFNNLVSSILLNKKVTDMHDLKLSFTERIRRPWIWDLNPYINAGDPRNITSGNPELKPEINRMLELAHHYTAASGFSLHSGIYFQSNSNAIESLRTVDSFSVSRTMPQNIAANKRLGANIFTDLMFSKSWTFSAGADICQVWYRSRTMQLSNDAALYSVNINSSWELPKDITLQFSGDYGNGYVTLQGRTSANYSYRFAVQKEFPDKKAGVTVSINNPFQNNFLQRTSATAPSFNSNTSSWYYNRSFSVSFNWKFGTVRASGEENEKETGEKTMRRKR
ncbi:outer membrane beta-barrel family protein [Chitinophaga solisilvae]|uniref:outer membrane beta-barrel family protein n=1 Tax=Chitinophaga solisilvae TaxID=1233460 RepID=UPI001370DDFC|nr:outer membrane beta-barrel family protein [Chitinophaga solisilvae]